MPNTKARLPSQVDPADWSATPKANTAVSYMYRDASNYKQHFEVILTGAMSLEQAVHVCGLLDDGQYFRPERLGLEISDWSLNGDGGHHDDDHDWHELNGIAPSDQTANGPTVEAFVAACEAACADKWAFTPGA